MPFIEADIKVAFATVDTIEQVADLRDGLRVGFPMYAQVDAVAIAEATGALYQTGDHTFLHATGFVLTPEGQVSNACYSSGPIGRMTPSDVLRKVAFEKKMRAG